MKVLFDRCIATKPYRSPKGGSYIVLVEEYVNPQTGEKVPSEINLGSKALNLTDLPTFTPLRIEADITTSTYKGAVYHTVHSISAQPIK